MEVSAIKHKREGIISIRTPRIVQLLNACVSDLAAVGCGGDDDVDLPSDRTRSRKGKGAVGWVCVITGELDAGSSPRGDRLVVGGEGNGGASLGKSNSA